MQRMQSFLISVKTLNMHKPLCIRTLIESISGIKIEIIQQKSKGKVVFKKTGAIRLKPGFSGPFIKKHLNSRSYVINFNSTLIQS